MSRVIDINCDLGEHADRGHDAALMPWITSCSVACGGHAGDRDSVEATVEAALAHGVAVGAHPSFPDREGFGRRKLAVGLDQLFETLCVQLQLVVDVAAALGGSVAHVKPHGALYNLAADCEQTSDCVLRALRQVCPEAQLFGLAASVTQRVALDVGHPFVPEAFADRRYLPTGRLLPRSYPDALIAEPAAAAAQAMAILAVDAPTVARTLCVHGDHPRAVEVLMAIDQQLAEQGVQKACP